MCILRCLVKMTLWARLRPVEQEVQGRAAEPGIPDFGWDVQENEIPLFSAVSNGCVLAKSRTHRSITLARGSLFTNSSCARACKNNEIMR